MNLRSIKLFKSISYSISSNFITLIISIVIMFLMPKIIGVREFGYWQLYLFYYSYIGFFHLGWNDGIYLRLGGLNYSEIDKALYFNQFILLMVSQLFISMIFNILIYVFIKDIDRIYVLRMLTIALIIENCRLMFIYILQSTYRISDYSQTIIFDRIIFITIVIFLLLLGRSDFKLLILSDVLSKIFSFIFVTFKCSDILSSYKNKIDFKSGILESKKNINVGIKLMLANIASMLIIGIVRFGIERFWDVNTFGKISLIISITNIMMIFINAIGIILFPLLRRISKENLIKTFITLRNLFMCILFGILTIYYPLKILISLLLPMYSDSIKYLTILFPIFVFEGKIALILNTYLKALRCENVILKFNFIVLIISLLVSFFTIFILKNLNFAILSIIFLIILRSILIEDYLVKFLSIRILEDNCLELILTGIFMISGWYFDSYISMIIYFLSYVIYLIIKRKTLIKSFVYVRDFLKV